MSRRAGLLDALSVSCLSEGDLAVMTEVEPHNGLWHGLSLSPDVLKCVAQAGLGLMNFLPLPPECLY